MSGMSGTKRDYKLFSAANGISPVPRCGSHQGHVFRRRSATDRASAGATTAWPLQFIPEGQDLPDLRLA